MKPKLILSNQQIIAIMGDTGKWKYDDEDENEWKWDYVSIANIKKVCEAQIRKVTRIRRYKCGRNEAG